MGIGVWTEDRTSKLRSMLSAGASYAEIAASINADTGSRLTRNACIGKATRLGISGATNLVRAKPAPMKRKQRLTVAVGAQVQAINRKRRAPVLIEEAFQPRTVNLPSHRKMILELRAMECRWPDEDRNEDGLHTFCGCRTADGSSYCPAHAELSKGQGTASERNAPGLLRRAAA